MWLQPETHEWSDFLRREPLKTNTSELEANIQGKTVLLTGAGGWIGSGLARRIACSGPRLLVLLDNAEQNLHRIHTDLENIAGAAAHLPVLADVCDAPVLGDLFEKYRPEIVYHAAAFKHVPLMEANPLAAIRNNAMGTYVLAKTAIRYEARKLMMISTDKAVNPRSVMGASKRLAELVVTSLSNERTRMSAVRFGNVLGSPGSVVLLFLQQIERGGPVTVTHPDARRFFLTLHEAIGLITAATPLEDAGCIWVPELGCPLKVVDLAAYLIRIAAPRQGDGIRIVFTGLRAGDKMEEQLVFSCESREPTVVAGLTRVRGRQVPADELEPALVRLADCLQRRDLAGAIQQLCDMVAEYQPSKALLDLIHSPRVAGGAS